MSYTTRWDTISILDPIHQMLGLNTYSKAALLLSI